ncbi:Hypothetical predicted protein [Cloeon dipterum]|uniref:Uncharacterized protein n=1 Tax=Cloeon dipterum TaxID=197152 RepID=A0A8S1EAT0_9INSE|nr:Hypothetical predicted protein [Cloeon dipterum]
MLEKKLYQIPKPSESSLRKLLASIKMPPGVLENVLTLMEIAGKNMSPMDKICVLSFDEVAVKPKTVKGMKEMCKEKVNHYEKDETHEKASEPTETEEHDYWDEENDEGNETQLEDDVENDVQEEDDEEIDYLDDVSEEEEDDEEDYISFVPVDWSPPDSEVDPDYHAGLRHIAEEIAGALGRAHPAIVGPERISTSMD